MIVSWNWLKQYVRLDMPVEELENRLMMAGLNHEGTTEVEGDLAVDLEVTSNRPDWLGHLGVAREVAVLFDGELKIPPADPAESGTGVGELTKVAVECPALCPRYIARVIQGVKIAESPIWMRRRLKTLGIAAINNIVDITNYVLMECGQPLHAFDLSRLSGRQIVVREPRKGEKLEAIDHGTYELEPGMCVIADAERPVAIGGVMGGAATEISGDTTELLIEAADFSPLAIRNAARRLKLFSDSSYRFERGVDPNGIDWASRRCCALILELAGGTLAAGAIDVSAPSTDGAKRDPIVLRFSQLKRILGIDVPADEVLRILAALGIEPIASDEQRVEATPPSWRRDLTREIDLVEEVARIHGYDKIPEDVRVPMGASSRSDRDRLLAKVRHVLTAAGFNEAITLSTVDEEWSQAFSPWSDKPPLQTSTPIIERSNLLRRSLAPSLLGARRTNETLGNACIELFEIANVYLPGDSLPSEELMLALCSGSDYFAVKGVLEAIIAELKPDALFEVRDTNQGLFGEHCAELHLNGKLAGYLGEVSAEGLKRFDLRGAATLAELRVSALAEIASLVPQYSKPPEYPAIRNDINLIVDESVRWSAIADVVRRHGGDLLEKTQYLETYRDDRLAGESKKKILFQISFRSSSGTLRHEQANQAREQIVRAFGDELDGKLG